MLNIDLDTETERYLTEIADQEKLDRSALVRQMIRTRWLEMQQSKPTVLERLGGPPKHRLPNSPGNLSDRDVRKQIIVQHIEQKRTQTSTDNA